LKYTNLSNLTANNQVKNKRMSDEPDTITIELMVTNKCNLGCSYCLEQHNTSEDWTLEKIKKVYDIALEMGRTSNKDFVRFQFFGGEPLLHKNMLVDFITTYKEELEANSDLMKLSIITNGLLLTEGFLGLWFSDPTRMINISLDTLDVEHDHREIKQNQLDKLLDTIEKHIPKEAKDQKRVGIRCTVSRETCFGTDAFIEKMYAIGIKTIVIHPLIFSSANMAEAIEWTDEEWNYLYETMTKHIIDKPDLEIKFVEGISDKFGPDNCFTDKNLFAVDAQGNFGGCYLIPNNKDLLGDYIMGNIFEDYVNTERYDSYNQDFREKRASYPECQECDLQDKCYTCPAMSLVLTGDAWAPTLMCKKMVSLAVLIEEMNKSVKFFMGLRDFKGLTEYGKKQRLFSAVYRKTTGNKNVPIDLNSVSLDQLLSAFGESIKLIQEVDYTEEEVLSMIEQTSPDYDYYTILNFLEVGENDGQKYSPEELAFFVHYFMNTKGKY